MTDFAMKRKFFLQNFLLLLVLLLIPVVILGSFSIIVIRQYIGNGLNTGNYFLLNQMKGNVELIAKELEPLTLAFGIDGQTTYVSKKLLDSVQLDYTEINILRNIGSQLSALTNVRPYIHSIYIYYKNEQGYFLTDTGREQLGIHPDTEWFDSYLAENASRREWSRRRTIVLPGGATQEIVSLYRLLDTRESVIVFNLIPQQLDRIIAGDLRSAGHDIAVLNEENTLLFGSSAFLTADGMKRFAATETADQGYFEMDVEGARYIVQTLRSGNGWRYALFSRKDLVFRSYYRLIGATLALLTAAVVLGVVLAVHFTRRRTKQVYDIVHILEAAENNRPLPEYSADRSTFGYIINNILNGFLQRSYLRTQLEARLYKLKTARLTALQAQLNPHFLFNTLETMNWNVYRITGKSNKVNDMIECLSELLRYSLADPEEAVTLKEEVLHIGYYLRIQEYRYRDKFEVRWDLADECLGAVVPRLILQPIIENSIYHGIKPMDSKGTIRISAETAEGTLTIRVSDDGVGMDAATLEEVRKRLRDSDAFRTESIGLHNVNSRLNLEYGTSLRIDSVAGRGTDVVMTIPGA